MICTNAIPHKTVATATDRAANPSDQLSMCLFLGVHLEKQRGKNGRCENGAQGDKCRDFDFLVRQFVRILGFHFVLLPGGDAQGVWLIDR